MSKLCEVGVKVQHFKIFFEMYEIIIEKVFFYHQITLVPVKNKLTIFVLFQDCLLICMLYLCQHHADFIKIALW